jgi:L-aminopeptidase/D-esterase-like protein
MRRLAAGALLACWCGAALVAGPATDAPNTTLTRVPGLKVGHVTLTGRPTGCTVVLAEDGAVGGVDVRGAAPGTRETDLLSPLNTVDRVHAIVLAGGSAFGLDAAGGTVRWLEEHGIGFQTRVARVPIVPSAILFDLGVGDARVRPTADCGYRAAAEASAAPVVEGSVGAGAGATVGKLRGLGRAMKGGIGSAAVEREDGLIVAALVAVNSLGDVIDPETGRVVAGVRAEGGTDLADARRLLRSGTVPAPHSLENTTLAVVATNARLTKSEATKVAQMAHDGFARAIWPVHTPADGDTVFALATGSRRAGDDLLIIGALAADVTARAIIRAVERATGLEGIPAHRDRSR